MEDCELQFKVFKTKNSQEMSLTVIYEEGKPTIKLNYTKKLRKITKTFDISTASKVFTPITDRRNYAFKILQTDLKARLSFYCKNEQIFHSCVKYINETLAKYHNVQQRNLDVEECDYMTMIRRTNYTNNAETQIRNNVKERQVPTTRESMETVYVPMQNNAEAQIRNNVQERPVPKTRRPSSVNFYTNLAYQFNYEIQEFNVIEKRLSGGCINLSEKSDFEIPSNLDNTIISTLKLREEICWPGGVEFEIAHYLYPNIKLVEIDNALWISQLTSKDDNLSMLHTGDKIDAVNDNRVTKEVEYVHCCKASKIVLRIVRLPKAKVFAINNDILKASINKDLVFSNSNYKFDSNQNHSWVLTEIDFMTNIDSKIIQNLTTSGKTCHSVVLHPKPFLNSLRRKRRSNAFKT